MGDTLSRGLGFEIWESSASPAGGRGRREASGEGGVWACSKLCACEVHHPHPSPLPPAGEGGMAVARLGRNWMRSCERPTPLPGTCRNPVMGDTLSRGLGFEIWESTASPAGGRGRREAPGEGGVWACSKLCACEVHHPHPSPLPPAGEGGMAGARRATSFQFSGRREMGGMAGATVIA